MRAEEVIVVGGGAAGVLAAAHLVRAGSDVVLVERSGRLGRGAAYGTLDPLHRLNVPAARMSAFVDDPEHFTRWWSARSGDDLDGAGPGGFARRAVYAAYLEEVLARVAGRGPGRLRVLVGEATDARLRSDGVEVTLDDERRAIGRALVLAVGWMAPARLAVPGGGDARVVADPWGNRKWLDSVAREEAVLLVGTGLTAVDVALTLAARGQRAPLVAISRHGLLPLVHRTNEPAALDDDIAAAEADERVRAAVRAILDGGGLAAQLRALREAADAGGDARALVDALRPHTSQLWRRLSRSERRRFLSHLRARWDTHRHRLAPEVGSAVATLVDDGGLIVRAGRLIGLRPLGERLLVDWRPRGTRRPVGLRVDRVINCTGPSSDLRRRAPPLVRALIDGGAARPCPLGLGLWVDEAGRAVDATGRARDELRVIGGLRRGEAWESVAVPELRVQAAALATALAPRPVSDIFVAEPGPLP